MNPMRRYLGVAALAALLFSGAGARADFIGRPLRLDYLFPDTSSVFASWTFTPGPGVDVNLNEMVANIDIDVSSANILFDFEQHIAFEPSAFNGPRFTDVTGQLPDIVGVSINPVTNLVGLDSSRIAFEANNIFVNFRGLEGNLNTVVSLDVQFAPEGAAVPEPAAFALLGVGAAALAGCAWRRRSRLLNL